MALYVTVVTHHDCGCPVYSSVQQVVQKNSICLLFRYMYCYILVQSCQLLLRNGRVLCRCCRITYNQDRSGQQPGHNFYFLIVQDISIPGTKDPPLIQNFFISCTLHILRDRIIIQPDKILLRGEVLVSYTNEQYPCGYCWRVIKPFIAVLGDYKKCKQQ